MLDIGRTVDRYTIEALLGQGGMAEVYRVRHATLDVDYALKVLTYTGKELRARLVAEGRAQSQLQHPNILRVLDVIDVDGQPGLILDYVDGPELGDWIVENKPDLETAEGLFRGIVAAVQTAHNAGLIHRDLKPANVLIATGPSGEPIPKVADFGLAKAVAGDVTLRATRSGMPMGTPAYMPPEQIRDAATVDERADIFALGCILFELVAHRPAFIGPDAISIFNQVLDGEHEPLPGGLPGRVTRTIEGCLQPDREDRLQTSLLMMKCLAGMPVKTTPAQQEATMLAAGGVALLSVASVAGVMGVAGLLYWSQQPESAVVLGAVACTSANTGWVEVNGGALPRTGATWTARSVAYLREGPPLTLHEDNDHAVVCSAPIASTATIGEAREDGWVAVSGIATALPDSPPPDDPPVCFGPVQGWVNVRGNLLGRAPRIGPNTWTTPSSKTLVADRPTEDNDWTREHDIVCELARGSETTLSGSLEKAGNTGWWVPIADVR